ALHPTAKAAAPTHDEPAVQAPARELRGLPVLVVVAGALGVGLFFGTVLTSLTAFLADSGRGDSAGLVYGVMGVGSTILALSITLFPARFRLSARWLVFSALMLAAMIGFGLSGGLTGLIGARAAARSSQGRPAPVMTVLGAATRVGRSAASALTGAVAESAGWQVAVWLPVGAAAVVLLAAVVDALACRGPGGAPLGTVQDGVEAEARVLSELPAEHL